jgi:thioredoxin:protein disulfide reductase
MSSVLYGVTPTAHTALLDETSATVTIEIPLQAGDYIYKEYLSFSTDDPTITITPFELSVEPKMVYDPVFKETKAIVEQPFSISFTITSSKPFEETVSVYMSSYQRSQKKIVQEVIQLPFEPRSQQVLETAIDTASASALTASEQRKESDQAPAPSTGRNWKESIAQQVKATTSWPLRLLAVFLLGLLMSLTPCIYPMIPITIGILQAQGSKSVWYNFLLSLSYTLGIATTFALLGVVAAFTKQAFGSLLAQPLFIFFVVALLIYLGLSMVGLYEMYIPRILQPKQNHAKGGSLLSAYLFGAASGTFASPCLSPGLVLLLTLVSAWGSKLIGFLFLFTFGIGLSIPLLVIGSFSGSLSLLPRAGMWMVEVKRLCGFFIIGVSFYFLNSILAPNVVLTLFSLFLAGTGIFYFASIAPHERRNSRWFKNLVGFLALASSLFFLMHAFKSRLMPENTFWNHDYYLALEQAKKENKKLLVDVGAPFCSICKAIDAGLFSNPEVTRRLIQCVSVKIDGSREDAACTTLKEKYSILGFPTILLIDPQTEQVIRQWGGELYDLSPQEFIAQLEQLL